MEGRVEYLAALGIDDWRQRRPLAGAMTAAPAAARRETAPVPAPSGESWDSIAAEVAQCRKCGLCETRTRTVFGVGDRNARWLVVGEAPGAEEDKQGEPFVGRAGGLLNSMLRGIGLAREQVFIANVLKCRPPNNRDPEPAEVVQCLPYLERQIALLKPSIMLAVGRIAAQNLLATDTPIGKLRGHVHAFGAAGIPLVITYHPAYLLRSPTEKRKAWEDLKFARRVASGTQA
jgi:uracil-DNA glycosylase